MKNMKEELKRITELVCANGNEERMVQFLKNALSPYMTVYTDALGNVIAKKEGKSGKTLAFCTHMNKFSFVVSHIEKDGKVRIFPYGTFDFSALCEKRVRFDGGTVGVIKPEDAFEKEKVCENLFVDIGASSKEEAGKKVKLSETAVLEGCANDICEGYFSAEGLDASVGIYAMCKCAKNIGKNEDNICFIFAAQNYAMLAGAQRAANENIDVAVSVGTAEGEGGLVLYAKDAGVVYPVHVREFAAQILQNENISYTVAVTEDARADTFYYKLGGALCARICAGVQNRGSASEKVRLSSVADLEKTLKKICEIGVGKLC